MDEPTRMYTNPNTGARKELKLCRLSLIDPAALHTLGEVAGYGATKYGDNNWTGGYPWSHSVDALYRIYYHGSKATTSTTNPGYPI